MGAIDAVNFYVIPALVLGSIYALGAIGISMIYAILRFAHFAHGDVLSLGAYVALFLAPLAGLPPIATVPAAMAVTAVVAVGIDRLFYRPFRRFKPIIMVIASFGVALMIRSAIQLIWGVEDEYYGAFKPPLAAFRPFAVAEKHLYIAAAVVVLVAATHYLLAYTRTGKAMRAMSDDADLARITGIGTERIVVWTWIVGASLAAAAGVLLGMDTRLKPDMGWNLLLPMFAAAILGGLGRPYGAIAGGMVIGFMEELSTIVIPGDYKSAVAFGVMVVMLIVRPQGIFKGRVL